MSIFGKVLDTVSQGFLGSVVNGISGQLFGLSKAEREQNDYNAWEAQKSRDFQQSLFQQGNAFNAEQAQINRDFQADQAATQYQRGVADMRAAGLNPALAYGQGGASAMQGATASAAGASAGAQASGNGRGVQSSLSEILQAAGFAKQLQKLDADIAESQSRTDLNQKNTEYRGLEIGMFNPLSEAKLKQIDSQLQTEAVERRLKESGISVNEAQRSLLEKNALLAGIDAETRGYLNQLEARQRVAQIALTYQNSAESRKRLDLIDSQITETLQRAVTEAAQAGLYDQQTENLLKEAGILEYEADMKQYQASKKKLSFVLDCVGKALGAVGSAALTFGAAGAGAKAFGLIGSAAGASSGMPFKSDAFGPLINSQRYGRPY